MGVKICNPCSKNNNDDDIIISQRNNTKIKNGDFLKQGNNHNFKLTEPEFTNLESTLKQKGQFLNENITQILEEINPLVNQINIPDEIKNQYSIFSIYLPAIKFSDGEIYDGEWNINHQRNGYGISINRDGNIYKGLWENDNFGKYGAFFDKKGNYYIGELVDGKANGRGEMLITEKMKFVGDFHNDLPYGKGVLENLKDKSIYTGDVVNGVKEGYGELKLIDGIIYEGGFKNDKFNGQGKITFPNGRKYIGEFKNNKMNGEGVFSWEDGKNYEGMYVDNMKQGYGKLTLNEDKYYEGDWFNNKQHGDGVLYFNGKKTKAKFRFGKMISHNNE